MKKTLKTSLLVPVLLISFSALLIILAEIIQSRTSVKPESYVEQSEKNLQRLEQKMLHSLDDVADITTDSSFHNYFIHQGFQEIGFSFFYVENETITKWSDNETDISSKMADTCKTNTLIHLNNGWYEIFIRKKEGKEIIGLLLIAKEYAYENQYLVNSFNPQFGLPEYASLAHNGDELSFHVRSSDNKTLFKIRFSNPSADSLNFDIKSRLYILSFLVFLLAFFLLAKIFS